MQKKLVKNLEKFQNLRKCVETMCVVILTLVYIIKSHIRLLDGQ